MYQFSVIQILKNENLDYRNIISNNSSFLENLNVEYIVYDNLQNTSVISFIKKLPKVKYFRKKFQSTKSGMLESGLLSSGERMLFLKSGDVISNQNLPNLESTRPFIQRNELKKITQLPRENFSFEDFSFLIKENKTFLEKVKLLFLKD